MNPATELTELPAVSLPVVEEAVTTVEPQPDQVQPHPDEWYGTAEFRQQLLLHFQKARRKAITSNPPDLPG